MSLLSGVLLAVSTVAASVAAVTSLAALGQSKEAAYYQYQAQELARLGRQRERVDKLGDTIERAFRVSAMSDPVLFFNRLPHALVGMEDRFPACKALTRSSVNRITDSMKGDARAEIARELSVISASEGFVLARKPRRGLFARWAHRNDPALPYPKATAP